MISFLFWNLQGRKGENREARMRAIRVPITRLAVAHKLDVLIFAECAVKTAHMKHALGKAKIGPFYCPPSRSKKIRIFTRISKMALPDVFNDPLRGRLTIRRLAV